MVWRNESDILQTEITGTHKHVPEQTDQTLKTDIRKPDAEDQQRKDLDIHAR